MSLLQTLHQHLTNEFSKYNNVLQQGLLLLLLKLHFNSNSMPKKQLLLILHLKDP